MSSQGPDQEITHRAAVLGSPIAHSLSPLLHNAGYEAAGLEGWYYDRHEATADTLPELVRGAHESYRGFSVTMPAKFAALDFAQETSPEARRIGSANTLVRSDAGWTAYNTDAAGITGALKHLGLIDATGAYVGSSGTAVLLGAGGTARPALYALAEAGVRKVAVYNRSDKTEQLREVVAGGQCTLVGYGPETSDDELTRLSTASDVVISTLPAGVIDDRVRALAHAPVIDVVYDPRPTPLLIQAAANGYPTADGLIMLAHQAFAQFELFTGVAAPKEAMVEALERGRV